MGKVNELLLRFEHSLESNQASIFPIAKSVLVLYVRGLFSDLEFPYAQFACKSLSGDLLFNPFGKLYIGWREWASKSLRLQQTVPHLIKHFFGCTHSHQKIISIRP